jgi:hypothetical protein
MEMMARDSNSKRKRKIKKDKNKKNDKRILNG